MGTFEVGGVIEEKARMMKRNMTEWMAGLISAQRVAAIPIMTHPGIELGGQTVRQAVSDGLVHAEAVIRLSEKYPSAAACTIMDLTTEAEAFGAQVVFSDVAVPAVQGRLLSTPEDIGRLTVPSLGRTHAAYLKANLLAARAIDDRPLLAGCIGPFSLAGRLYDMSDIMVLICENPTAAHELLEKCTDFILKYCMALRQTGANGVVMAEPAAGLMSNDDCVTFSSKYVKPHRRPRAGRHVHGGAPQLRQHGPLHQGHGGHGCRCLPLRQQVPHGGGHPRRAAHGTGYGQHRPRVGVQGRHTADMKQAVTALLDQMRPYPNFVLSSGCDTPPHTPAENIDAFFEALEEWSGQF